MDGVSWEFWHLCYAVQFCQREQKTVYFPRTHSAMLYGSETWSVKEKDMIRLERSDARIVRWMFKIRPEDTISAEELRNRLKLKSMRECLKYRRMEWFTKCATIQVRGSFPRGQPTIIHKIFETNSGFHVKWHSTGKV